MEVVDAVDVEGRGVAVRRGISSNIIISRLSSFFLLTQRCQFRIIIDPQKDSSQGLQHGAMDTAAGRPGMAREASAGQPEKKR